VKVTGDGRERSFWTTATNVGDALAALGVNSAGADLSTSRSATIGRSGLAVDVATLKTVTIQADGKKRAVKTTAQTVGAALAQAKITVDADDELKPGKTSRLANGTTVTVVDVEVDETTKTRSIDFDTVRRNTNRLERGDTKVDTVGRAGERTIVYREVRRDGELASRTKISSKITAEPRDRVLLVGTKEPEPAPQPRPEPEPQQPERQQRQQRQQQPEPEPSQPSSSGDSVWDRLAQCESGGNWSINTGNGYYGGLQFSLSTWRANGGSGMPHQASRAEQIRVAKRVQASQGWGAWPACTAKLGIR